MGSTCIEQTPTCGVPVGFLEVIRAENQPGRDLSPLREYEAEGGPGAEELLRVIEEHGPVYLLSTISRPQPLTPFRSHRRE